MSLSSWIDSGGKRRTFRTNRLGPSASWATPALCGTPGPISPVARDLQGLAPEDPHARAPAWDRCDQGARHPGRQHRWPLDDSVQASARWSVGSSLQGSTGRSRRQRDSRPALLHSQWQLRGLLGRTGREPTDPSRNPNIVSCTPGRLRVRRKARRHIRFRCS